MVFFIMAAYAVAVLCGFLWYPQETIVVMCVFWALLTIWRAIVYLLDKLAIPPEPKAELEAHREPSSPGPPDVEMILINGPLDGQILASKIHPSRLIFYKPWTHAWFFCEAVEPERCYALYRLEKLDKKSDHFVEAVYVFVEIVPGVIKV